MSDNKESLLKRKCRTPKFRASYVNVFTPSAMDEGDAKKYNITMLFDEDEDMTEMKRAAHYAAVEAWGKDKTKWPKKRKMPFRNGSEEKPDNKEYAGKIFVYASSKEDKKPGVVDRDAETKLTSDEEFYSGCYGRATLIAFHYKTKGNEGISFALQNIQKWDDGEKLGGKRDASQDFDALDDAPSEDDDAEMDDDFLGEND